MKLYEIATGYTPIPARVGAATELVVEELSKSFQAQSIDVTVLDIKNRNRPDLSFPIIEVSLPSFLLKLDHSLGLFHKVKRVLYSIAVASLIRRILLSNIEKVAMHFHNQYNFYFFHLICSRSLIAKSITMYTVHSYIWNKPWEEISSIVHKKYFMEIKAVKAADIVFVLNERIACVLVEKIGVDPKRIVLIPNGVNDSVYRKIEAMKSGAEIVKDEFVLVHAGSVCDRKNQLGIIRNLLPLLKKKQIVFCYAGGVIDLGYQKAIHELCKAEQIEENVRYCGEIPPGRDMNEFYNTADCFIFDSESEAFSLVILEAMAAGLPTLLHKRQKMSFLPEKDSGIIYYETEDLLSVISKLMSDSSWRKDVATKSQLFVRDNYSWDRIARMYYETAVSLV